MSNTATVVILETKGDFFVDVVFNADSVIEPLRRNKISKNVEQFLDRMHKLPPISDSKEAFNKALDVEFAFIQEYAQYPEHGIERISI